MLKFFSQLRGWLERRRIQILPPLRPPRIKPFPQRPHHRRRQAVFAALATALPNATINELIAHVRSVTGVGCSRKLIVQWKQEQRQRERELGGQRDTTRQRNLFASLLLFCLGLSVWNPALNVGAQEITISPAPSETPPVSNPPPPISSPAVPRLLRIKLTLNMVSDLRIKQGDEVQAGALLTDRRQARRRLLLQKRALEFAARHLQIQMQLTAESLRQLHSLGLALPPTTFAAEQAAIKRAEAEAVAVHRAVDIQRQRVASFASLVSSAANPLASEDELQISRNPKPETRNLIAAHESAKLTQAQDQQLRAQAEIELHQAKLATAREVRAWEEQKHRVEITRQLLSARSQQQQAEIEVARLSAQIAELDLQLAQLAEVHTPFAGTIKRIEWEEMNDEKITVVVYLVVGSSR